jgi:hypothetical protein
MIGARIAAPAAKKIGSPGVVASEFNFCDDPPSELRYASKSGHSLALQYLSLGANGGLPHVAYGQLSSYLTRAAQIGGVMPMKRALRPVEGAFAAFLRGTTDTQMDWAYGTAK